VSTPATVYICGPITRKAFIDWGLSHIQNRDAITRDEYDEIVAKQKGAKV
jgi:recombinational DNA repair ATPase RecF